MSSSYMKDELIVLKSAEELKQFNTFNVDYANKKESHLVFLGESWYGVTFYNLLTDEVVRYKKNQIKIPTDVMNYLLCIGKVLPDELVLEYSECSENTNSIYEYMRDLSEHLGKKIEFDAIDYYGSGEAGCNMSEEHAQHIRDNLGFYFR